MRFRSSLFPFFLHSKFCRFSCVVSGFHTEFAKMTQDAEMKELPAPVSSSSAPTSPSTLQRKKFYLHFVMLVEFLEDLVLKFVNDFFQSDLKEIVSLIETGAYAREVRRIVRAIRLTMALRRKLKASVLSSFLNFSLPPGSDVHTRLSSFIPKVIRNLMEILMFIRIIQFPVLNKRNKLQTISRCFLTISLVFIF